MSSELDSVVYVHVYGEDGYIRSDCLMFNHPNAVTRYIKHLKSYVNAEELLELSVKVGAAGSKDQGLLKVYKNLPIMKISDLYILERLHIRYLSENSDKDLLELFSQLIY